MDNNSNNVITSLCNHFNNNNFSFKFATYPSYNYYSKELLLNIDESKLIKLIDTDPSICISFKKTNIMNYSPKFLYMNTSVNNSCSSYYNEFIATIIDLNNNVFYIYVCNDIINKSKYHQQYVYSSTLENLLSSLDCNTINKIKTNLKL